MPATDPLAHERFRTILTEAIALELNRAYDSDSDANEELAAENVLSDFPDAHFEYRTNEHGVRVRKVVVEGTWEVDPNPQKCPNCAPGYDCERGIYAPA